MAKGNGNKKQAAANGSEKPMPAYFKSLTIENVKCFKGKHTIDLSDGKGKPAQWTVILGNNNTGKTTILKCLAGMQPYTYKHPATSTPILVTFAGEGLSLSEFYRAYSNNIFRVEATVSLDTVSKLGMGFNISFGFANDYSFHNLVKGDDEPIDEVLYRKTSFFSPFNQDDVILKKLKLVDAFQIAGYGVSRKMSQFGLDEIVDYDSISNLFKDQDLVNAEDWLLNLFLAEKLGQVEAKNTLELAKEILISGILPDVQEVRLRSEEKGAGFENFVEFRTDFGWIRLRDLGYGYQTMIAWVLDLVKRMVERYPGSPNPLAEPAIVLVDEIDLHLHPDWQRRIIAHLTKYFPNTQFIVTAHSPLIVQSAEEINLVILKKEGESVHIEQPKIRTFRGWTVEEILTDLMALEGQTMSQTYLDLMQQFDDALDADDFEKAEAAYNELDKILHPNSHQRKLLQLQMTSLSPADAV